MATDNRSTIAGNFSHGYPITCILCEEAITVSTSGYTPTGLKERMATYGAEIVKGDLVYLIAGTKNLYVETEGMPVVHKLAAGTFYSGIVTSDPKPRGQTPTATKAYTDCDNADWAAILSGKYYRMATVELFGITGVFEADVKCDGSNEVAIGAVIDLKWDVSEGCFVPVASGGAGLLPMHYVPAGSAGDQYSILVGALADAIVAVA